MPCRAGRGTHTPRILDDAAAGVGVVGCGSHGVEHVWDAALREVEICHSRTRGKPSGVPRHQEWREREREGVVVGGKRSNEERGCGRPQCRRGGYGIDPRQAPSMPPSRSVLLLFPPSSLRPRPEDGQGCPWLRVRQAMWQCCAKPVPEGCTYSYRDSRLSGGPSRHRTTSGRVLVRRPARRSCSPASSPRPSRRPPVPRHRRPAMDHCDQGWGMGDGGGQMGDRKQGRAARTRLNYD